MKGRKKTTAADDSVENAGTPEQSADEENTEGATDSKRLHLHIARANWKRIEAEIDSYNHDPDRITPKISPVHIVNKALAEYFGIGEGRH